MRQDSRPAGACASAAPLLTIDDSGPGPEGDGRRLVELMAVLIGVCETLADGLEGDRHGELARVGLLAASRAAELAANLRAGAGSSSDGAPTSQASSSQRVLIVEDDADLLNLLTAAFVRAGFATHSARNGRDAVKLLEEVQPDLLITDIVMPELEGIGVLREAKRRAPGLRVIAISGGGRYGRSHNFLEWAAELGADEVLAKPFRVSSLITAARLVLDQPANAN
jgi:CheY-like chemotaxis protein